MKLQLFVALCFVTFSSFVSADSHLGDDTILPFRPVGYGNQTDSGSFALSASIADYSPKWSWLDLENTSDDANKNWITISGCGFKQFAEAVCVFDFKFTSTYSYIHDDNTIYCELPTKSTGDFDTLPQVSRLDVVFDGELSTFDSSDSNNGNRVLYVGPFRWGPQIECDDPISPLRGDTSGDRITVHGQGFADAALSELKVWVDDQECTGSSVQSDTAITCSAPEAVTGGFREINKYSVVSVTWGADSYWSRTSNGTEPECYLHANRMYKYGPEVVDIFPPCTSVYGEGGAGNQELTIRGAGFADSAFSVDPTSPDGSRYTNEYLIEVTLTDSVLPENPFKLQSVGTVNPSGTEIRFRAPDFFHEFTQEGDSDWDALFGKVATVVVYYRQLNRWYSIDTNESPLSFTYGPIIDYIDDKKLHAGGGDKVCFYGCGFLNYTDHLDVFFQQTDDLCGEIDVIGDDEFCCNSLLYDCGVYTPTVRFHNPQLPVGSNHNSLASPDDVTVGPIAESLSPAAYRVTPQQNMVVSGDNFEYSASCSSQDTNFDFGCWEEFPTMTGNGPAKPYKCNKGASCDVVDVSIDDTTVTFGLPTAEFGASFSPTIEWVRPNDISNPSPCEWTFDPISFGPTCEQETPSTAIFGGGQVTIDGTFFEDYEVYVRLCRLGATNCDGESEYENVTSTRVVNDERISFVTENWQTSAEKEFNRGRRFWAQQFDVLIWFNSQQDGLVSNTNYDYTFDEDCFDCGGSTCENPCRTFARLHCGAVRFGPTISSIEPCKGPISGSTAVEIVATDSADRWAQPRDDDALTSHNLVTFGTLFGLVGPQSDSVVSTTTVWGATANSDAGVSVIFDACNITAPVTDSDDYVTVAWGPDLYFKSKGDSQFALDFDSATNFWRNNDTNSETYGFWWGLPVHGDAYPVVDDDILTIKGHGFDEFSHFAASVDGVLVEATLDGSDHLNVVVPVRPFGTIAKVCVHFGELKCNNHVSVFTGKLESNYRYKICSEEYLVYQPYVGALGATNFRTSGFASVDTSGDITGDVAGTTLKILGDHYFGEPQIFVGQYKADVTNANSDDVAFNLPTFSAEFNSYASVRVEWETPDRNTEDNDEWYGCDEDNDRHWGVVAQEMIHFGPICSGAHTANGNWLLGTERETSSINLADTAYPFVGRDDTPTNLVVTLKTQFLIDCTHGYDNDQDCPAGSNLNNCTHPQFSTELQNIQTEDETGIFKRCLHRNVEVRISDFGSENPFGGDDTDYSVAGNDVIFKSVEKTDVQIQSFVKARDDNIDCTFITFGLYFPDALVTRDSQRQIECTDSSGDIWKHYYGPTIDYQAGALWYRDDTAVMSSTLQKIYRGGVDDVTDLPRFYGFGYLAGGSDSPRCESTDCENVVEISVTGARDNFFVFDLEGNPRSANELFPQISDNNRNTVVFDPNEVVWHAPVESLGDLESYDLFWARDSQNSNGICQATIFQFHYGPVITHSSRDKCNDPVPIRHVTSAGAAEDDKVVIFGRAFTCCQFEEPITTSPSASADDVTACYFTTGSSNRATRNTYIRDSGVDKFHDELSEISCNVPNSDSPEPRLAGFGLCFNCPAATSFCGSSDGAECDGSLPSDSWLVRRTNTDTDDVGYMDICYGPKLQDDVDLGRARMSGLDNVDGHCVAGTNVNSDDPELLPGYYANAQEVTLSFDGIGDTAGGNNILYPNAATNSSFCAQCSFDVSWSNEVVTTSCHDYEEDIDCRVPVFLHQCGDGPDAVFVEWLYHTDGEARSYIQHDFDYPATITGTTWLNEENTRVDEYLYYGPTATSDVSSHSSINMDDRKQFRLPTTGNSHSISVSLDYFADWDCWNSLEFMCIVENDDGYVYRSLDDGEAPNSVDVVSFDTQTLPEISSGDAACLFGDGYFGAEGKLRVLLDPHVDRWTVLSSIDLDFNPVGDRSYWHWHASSSVLSKNWGGPSGLEPITFYGSGFCEYSHVQCIFDQAGEKSSYAVQGDIIGDGMVVCQTPPSHAPQAGSLSLSFCGSGDFLSNHYDNDTLPCDCNFGHCETADEISLSFTFVGAEDVHPRHGPVFGNTTVYFKNIGLEDNSYYDRIECVFHIDGREEVVLATATDLDVNVTVSPEAGTFSCVTPPVENGRQHALVEIRGYYNTFENQMSGYLFDANLGCFWFDYGYPTVRSVSPSTSVYGSADNVIVVRGDYFNGGTSTGDYLCYWQHGPSPSSDLPDELGEDPTFSTGNVHVTEGLRVNVAGNWDDKDFNDFEIHCITPSFAQIGAYPFDISFQNAEVTSQLYGSPVWRYDVTAAAANIEFVETDYFDDDDDDETPIEPGDYYMDELGGVITLHGTGFAGGRLESDDHTYGYVCTFEASLNGTDVVRHTIALSDVSNTEVVCVAPYFELTDNDLETAEIVVSLSVDGGYSLQASTSLQYRSNSDLVECLEDGAAQSLLLTSFFFVLSMFVLHFMF